MIIKQCKHPLLYTIVFHTVFSVPAAQFAYNEKLDGLLLGTSTPDISRSDLVVNVIRNMLRYGGYKPAGRGKPSSEYLYKLKESGLLPSVNPVVDIGNAVSCYSGIPLSVVDLKKLTGSCCIRLGDDNERYVFNQSGQVIECNGLIVLSDSEGPCANPVKDSMRTKTDAATLETITVLWGAKDVAAVVEDTFLWYKELLSDVDKYSYVEQCMAIE